MMLNKSLGFVRDFKNEDESNELVKLCMDQGWEYKRQEVRYGTVCDILYHRDAIYADTLKHYTSSFIERFEPGDKKQFQGLFSAQRLNEIRNSYIMIPLPKELHKKYYVKEVEVSIYPEHLLMDRVVVKGRNPHSPGATPDLYAGLCIGTLHGISIHQLWRMYDMLRVITSVFAEDYWLIRGLNKDVGKSLVTTSKRQPRRDVRLVRDLVRDIVNTGKSSGVFNVA